MPPKRSRRTIVEDDSSSEDEQPLSKIKKTETSKKKSNIDDSSSSESDIEDYLQPVDKIDFNSDFFKIQPKKTEEPSFDAIEKDIFAGVSRLTDSESDDDGPKEEATETQNEKETVSDAVVPKASFQQLYDYSKKIEEVKQLVEKYEAKKRADEDGVTNISSLLAAGESKSAELQDDLKKLDLHASDFEESDSDGGWEEVEAKSQKEKEAPKENLEITVEMPGAVRTKKKGVDLLAAIKRRLNRMRKENQVLIHKVHLLCWLGHGNYVNSIINSENVMALALSLLPSQHCYPEGRTDLKYLEQIVQWYRKAVRHVEKKPPELALEKLISLYITNREAFDKKTYVYIFVAILRSIGIQCRFVISLQVEPIRPPNSELLSLSTKDAATGSKTKKETKVASKEKIVPKVEKKLPAGPKSAKKETTKIDSKSSSSATSTQPKVTTKANKPSSSKTSLKATSSQTKATSSQTKATSSQTKATSSQTKVTKSTKTEKPKDKASEAPKTKNARDKSVSETRKSVSTTESTRKSTREKSKSVSETSKNASAARKSVSEATKPRKSGIGSKIEKVLSAKRRVVKSTSQLDGNWDSDEEEIVLQLDGADDKPNLTKLNGRKTEARKSTLTKPKYKDTDSEEEFSSSPAKSTVNLKKLRSTPRPSSSLYFKSTPSTSKNPLDVRGDIVKLVKKGIREQVAGKKLGRKTTSKSKVDDSDSDFNPEPLEKKRRESADEFVPKIKVKKRVNPRKVLSSDEESKPKKKIGVDVWAEVFLETEEKWISVDVIKGQVHCVNELHTRATHPVSYVVAWNNNNTLKDITRRYCQNFNTVTRKLRIDADWWQASLKPFIGPKTARDREEDDELDRQQLEKPLPTSISEYKNHPLYALKRHLLKFEGIYPPDAPTLGFVRNEAVYSRQCVYTLHSRDIWLKQARVVKKGEQPYKIVKARPKYDKLSNSVITDQLLEIFGPWQTEEYVPPTAENGVVPRNAYGNVELFKKCMLPKKTVHLQLPGLNKIARRMNIDCATAIVGFDFHGGWSHPTYDGFVVCEEFEDVLIAAWELEQEELQKKEQEKTEKRVYGNWRKLIRGLLIRERLKAKYDFGEASTSGTKKGKKLVAKKRTIVSSGESESE